MGATYRMGATFTIAPLLPCDERRIVSVPPMIDCEAWVPHGHGCHMGAMGATLRINSLLLRMGGTLACSIQRSLDNDNGAMVNVAPIMRGL